MREPLQAAVATGPIPTIRGTERAVATPLPATIPGPRATERATAGLAVRQTPTTRRRTTISMGRCRVHGVDERRRRCPRRQPSTIRVRHRTRRWSAGFRWTGAVRVRIGVSGSCHPRPFTVNPTGTLIVRNRYRLLECFRADCSRSASVSVQEAVFAGSGFALAGLIRRASSSRSVSSTGPARRPPAFRRLLVGFGCAVAGLISGAPSSPVGPSSRTRLCEAATRVHDRSQPRRCWFGVRARWPDRAERRRPRSGRAVGPCLCETRLVCMIVQHGADAGSG